MSRKKNFFKDMRQIVHKNLDPMMCNYKKTYDEVMKFLKYQKRLDQLGEENNDALIVYLMGEEIINWTFSNFDMLVRMEMINKDEDNILEFIYKKICSIPPFGNNANISKQIAQEVLKNNKVKIFKMHHDLTR